MRSIYLSSVHFYLLRMSDLVPASVILTFVLIFWLPYSICRINTLVSNNTPFLSVFFLVLFLLCGTAVSGFTSNLTKMWSEESLNSTPKMLNSFWKLLNARAARVSYYLYKIAKYALHFLFLLHFLLSYDWDFTSLLFSNSLPPPLHLSFLSDRSHSLFGLYSSD